MNRESKPVAIVTGASRGIGRALAEHLNRSGHRMLSASRQPLGRDGGGDGAAGGDSWTHVSG